MKKLFIILFLFIPISLGATIWYVSPTGNDSNDGTASDDDHAWKTWGKAFNSGSYGTTPVINPGDTVYFMGGVYNKNIAEGISWWYYPDRDAQHGSGYAITRDGTVDDTLKYWAYPGQTPILDCYNADPSYRLNYGIRATGVNYVHFKGLTVRNVREYSDDNDVTGMLISSNHCVFEQCNFTHIWGHGLNISGAPGSVNYVINCDAHNCCDSLDAASPGNDGTGMMNFGGGSVYFYGCRAWKCGDQGFSTAVLIAADLGQYTEFDRCWSFSNGMLEGFGHGFKYGWIYSTDGNLKRLYKNCISAYNRSQGFKSNDGYSNYANYAHIYNCISYHNGYDPAWTGSVEAYVCGFQFNNTNDSDEHEYLRIVKNSISYDNESGAVYPNPSSLYTHDHNDWDITLSLDDDDFESVDSTGITAVRQADGSLPDNDCYDKFLHPAAGGIMIGEGTDLGIIYDAAGNVYDNPTPAIGAFEYPEVEPTLVESIDIWGTGGATTIESEGGTLQMLKKTLPVDATDTTVVWSVIEGTGDAEISSSGLLTAQANGTVTVRATANDASGIYGEEEITISNQNPDAGLPTVSTTGLIVSTSIWAILDGDVTDDGGATATRGMCWNTTGDPTTADSKTIDGTGIGVYTSTLTGLKGYVTYYVRAYATNIEGTSYGNNFVFTTPRITVLRSGGKRLTSGIKGQKYIIISR